MTKTEWQEAAYVASIRWARAQRGIRRPQTFESIRGQIAAAYKRLPEPIDGRHWGSVAKQLIREGWLKQTPATAPARSSHYARKPCYWVTVKGS